MIIYHKLKVIVLGIVYLTPLWATCPISLTSPVVSPAPMTLGSEGTTSFVLSDISDRPIPLDNEEGLPSCVLTVDLNAVELKNHDLSLISPDISDYFTLSYDDVTHEVIFTQNIDIPADLNISVNIPVDVTEESTSENPLNGFEVTVANEDMSASEYTSTVEVSDPDYRPILTVYGGVVYGQATHQFSFDTLVRDLAVGGTYQPGEPLEITIPKNKSITLNYDVELTTFKGLSVQNNLWDFDNSDPFDYSITYNGSQMPNAQSRFALTGSMTVEEGEVGKFILETTIKSTTGGDSNIDNNSDRDTLQKRL
ncbi:MAG: Unknown protein [uncultured Sulfurovum sp.]|uniref:Uncharacterized protein n=1 Tax=uncultured Sulfurovum sp. TaxID=269237 RepID=A0A6S6SI62_9BACT|nr:MAG: Unknown protein [uncultured Sulfurovum sp.]